MRRGPGWTSWKLRYTIDGAPAGRRKLPARFAGRSWRACASWRRWCESRSQSRSVDRVGEQWPELIRRLAQAPLQGIIAAIMTRVKALSAGLLAGSVAAAAMTVTMLLLACLGVATPLVIIGDRLSVFISPGPFLSLMGKVGGYNHLKEVGVGSDRKSTRLNSSH